MDGSSSAGVPEIKPVLDVAVAGAVTAPPTSSAAALPDAVPVPLPLPLPVVSMPNGTVAPTPSIIVVKKAPAKRARKAAVSTSSGDTLTPAKPRPPRKKPTNPPAPRSRAKAKGNTKTANTTPQGTISVAYPAQNEPHQQQILQGNFINNLTSYTLMQSGMHNNQMNLQPINIQQAQPQQAGQQQQQRGTRVLLPKPASGQTTLRPAPLPTTSTLAPPNHVQFQNGTPVMLGGQQFMSFQNANGQMQLQATTSSGTVDLQTPAPTTSTTAGQMTALTGQQQMIMVNSAFTGQLAPPPGQVMQPGGKMIFMGTQAQSKNQGFDASTPSAGANPQLRMMTALPQHQVPQQQAGQSGTVQVRLQVVQTSNGPMTLAFFPDQSGSFNNAPAGMQFQSSSTPQQNHLQASQLQSATGGGTTATSFNLPAGMQQLPQQEEQQRQISAGNFVSVSALAAQAGAHQQNSYLPPPVQAKKEEDVVEAEFNLEEFLMPGMFTTPSAAPDTSGASLQSNQLIMDELVSGPIFQSAKLSASSVSTPPLVTPPVKPKRKRTKKATPNVKQGQTVEFRIISENKNLKKVEEILKSYAEEKNRHVVDALPSAPFLLSTPLPSALPPAPSPLLPVAVLVPPLKATNVKSISVKAPTPGRTTAPPRVPAQAVVAPPVVPVVPQRPASPPLPPPPPSPPPAPKVLPRQKTDLAIRYEKDEKFLEKLTMKPFKGINSSINRLLPFHLLATADDMPDFLQRESRAFHHVACSMVEREAGIYTRFSQRILADAAEPIPKLDILTSSSTWLDNEREEFEAEKLAAAEGKEGKPPVWVYTDMKLETNIPYHDGNLLLGFTEPVEDVPGPPPSLPPPSPRIDSSLTTPPTVTVVSSPQAGKLKLRIKRSLPLACPTTTVEAPPKKISLKFKMSAKAGWVVGRSALSVGGGVAGAVARIPGDGEGDETSPVLPAEGGLEDVLTRSAVDSILHVGVSAAGALASVAKTDSPVMSNDLYVGGQDYFYGSGHYGQTDTDTALDEAINSILG